jgi:hypothetical protein
MIRVCNIGPFALAPVSIEEALVTFQPHASPLWLYCTVPVVDAAHMYYALAAAQGPLMD